MSRDFRWRARVTSRKAPVGQCRLVVSRSRAIFRAAPPALALVQVTGTAPRASIALRRDAKRTRNQRPFQRRRSTGWRCLSVKKL